ncbi:response regulator [Amycolatopsis alkalitolerans]|uniref:Response regulator n=1 Tax=Amycolatopsis alkalitolerans TaxID=2547244 RepID=A0A5C4LX42_9PSEU|nr:response regulator [Amycolatopsis alkalitolerans]
MGARGGAADEHKPDVAVLDLGLPDLDGAEVITGLRGWSRAPIIVLSGRTATADKVAALAAGADDYVTKPFDVAELLARIRVAVRHATVTAPDPGERAVDAGDFTVDLAAKKVARDGRDVRLTPTEWAVLEILVRDEDLLVTGAQLLNEVWGPEHAEDTHYLRVYVAQLRRKLEPNPSHPRHLITEPGVGYRFTREPER